MQSRLNTKTLLPIIFIVALISGMWIGRYFTYNSLGFANNKLNSILNLISEKYVDTICPDSILEKSYPNIISQLDPHSSYIPAKDLKATNEELDGSFSGIGISFSIMNDTITIIEIIPGGPSEKAGLLAGDRITKIDTINVAGITISNERVMSLLRGNSETKVSLEIKRNSSHTPLKFDITRGNIPVNSVDAAYIIAPTIGYIKINKFSRNTYDEFITALNNLQNQGASKYIIDLRGNGGGYMGSAILMANEFLPKGHMIVNTKYRTSSSPTYSDGNGSFTNAELVILIDEFSASASEIFAGAIQDHDRGLILGRRSFGKGLVQQQIELLDSSAIRLTIARYHTPSGRCIQKEYKAGDKNYNYEVYERFNHGEAFNADSIKLNEELEFLTANGRKVYGGGGIMPDIFIPNDTSGITKYYYKVANAGLLQKFAFNYSDKNRAQFKDCKTANDVLSKLPNDDLLLYDFVDFGKKNNIQAKWYQINQSKKLILIILKSLITRDIIGNHAYYEVYNTYDNNVINAVEQFGRGTTKIPVTIEHKWKKTESEKK